MEKDISKIWHKPDVRPRDLSWILIKFSGAVIEKGYYDAAHNYVVVGLDTCSWSTVTRWCYIDDIYPED